MGTPAPNRQTRGHMGTIRPRASAKGLPFQSLLWERHVSAQKLNRMQTQPKSHALCVVVACGITYNQGLTFENQNLRAYGGRSYDYT
jgi:hypothetical protein